MTRTAVPNRIQHVNFAAYDDMCLSNDRSLFDQDGWYYVTYGPFMGWVVNVDLSEVSRFGGGHVVLAPDLEDFLREHPEFVVQHYSQPSKLDELAREFAKAEPLDLEPHRMDDEPLGAWHLMEEFRARITAEFTNPDSYDSAWVDDMIHRWHAKIEDRLT